MRAAALWIELAVLFGRVASVAVSLGVVLAITPLGLALAQESVCYGTAARGRITGAVRLPTGGKNFQSYSRLGAMAGRTYVHSRIQGVVVTAYAAVAESSPSKVFVYGETGKQDGGEFRPHKTHQNGLSVDFMVPVMDATGKSVPLPTGVFNKFGYGIEFDPQGRYKGYSIDFDAMADHLYALQQAAKAAGVGISRVIFDPQLQPLLFRTRRGARLKAELAFSPRPVWIRHDEHYHVDFAVACRPLH